ncbi:MAG TPA: hypothetical protein VGK16_13195 [Candidatus Limnocylindrales bacterium]
MTSGLARRTREHDTPTLLRRGLLGLAALGLARTVLELAFLRHWSGATQLLVWPGVIALAAALLALVRHPSARAVRIARAMALVVVAIAVVGVGFHVLENLDAGPLDRAYAATWDRLIGLGQLWLATTGGVGPAPVLAPGALAEIALCLLLATLRHPALES